MNSKRDTTADALRDAAHNAFVAFWYGADEEQAALRAAHCVAQEHYDAYLMRAE